MFVIQNLIFALLDEIKIFQTIFVFWLLYSKILNPWVVLEGSWGEKKKTEREKGLRKSRYVTTLPHSIVWGKYRCKRETCEHWSNEDLHPTGWQHFWEMEGFQGRPSNVRDLVWDDQSQQLNVPKHVREAISC